MKDKKCPGCSNSFIHRNKYYSKNCLEKNRKHSEQTKKKISESRKKYLRDNKDKHPWKRKNKFISTPCENVKKYLDDNNINYISEWSPLEDRFYSIDIAFPDKKIGIEINGNQHYNKDGTLKDYYQKRYDEWFNKYKEKGKQFPDVDAEKKIRDERTKTAQKMLIEPIIRQLKEHKKIKQEGKVITS